MQKEIDNPEFVQNIHFELINSLKNNGTKYLLILDDSCAEVCNSKEFVNIGTTGRHRGFSTIYNKHNLFHQSKLGRDVELQNTHTMFFSSHLDMCIKLPPQMYCWDLDQLLFNGFGVQRLYLLVIC